MFISFSDTVDVFDVHHFARRRVGVVKPKIHNSVLVCVGYGENKHRRSSVSFEGEPSFILSEIYVDIKGSKALGDVGYGTYKDRNINRVRADSVDTKQ
jgi:hypothetical protein